MIFGIPSTRRIDEGAGVRLIATRVLGLMKRARFCCISYGCGAPDPGRASVEYRQPKGVAGRRAHVESERGPHDEIHMSRVACLRHVISEADRAAL